MFSVAILRRQQNMGRTAGQILAEKSGFASMLQKFAMFQIHLVRAALERGSCWLPLFIATLNTYDERSIIIISR